MNDGLLDAFRHNAWATRALLAACRGLSETQLQMSAPGVFGSSIETLRHIVASEAGYCRRLTGDAPDWFGNDDAPGLDELTTRADELAARWERFLAQPFDAERTFALDWENGQVRDVPAGVVLAQALHHGNEHRGQVCTVLTAIGATAPELGVWEFAEATNRARPRTA